MLQKHSEKEALLDGDVQTSRLANKKMTKEKNHSSSWTSSVAPLAQMSPHQCGPWPPLSSAATISIVEIALSVLLVHLHY